MGGSAQHSNPSVVAPFGHLPNAIARLLSRQQLGPLIEGLGLGTNAKTEGRLAGATGPLADFIRSVRGFAPGVIGQAQNVGNVAATQGQQSYDQLMTQINSATGALPNYQSTANQGLDFARQSAVDAYSPIRQSAMFQNTANNVLTPLRQSQAARGFESQGGAQQQEQNVLQGLGTSFAQNQLGNQQAALQGLQGATGFAQGLSQAGIPLAQARMGAVGDLQNYLSQQYMAPLQGAGGLLSLLTAGQTPGIQLTQGTAPQIGNRSKGSSGHLI